MGSVCARLSGREEVTLIEQLIGGSTVSVFFHAHSSADAARLS